MIHLSTWKELTSLEEWSDVLAGSSDKPVLVFKHSTTCPISAKAFKAFETYLNDSPNENVDYVLVKVQRSRPVSNQIESDLGIKHESPQTILVRNNEAVWNTDHSKITVASLGEALQ
jgi:bacillithiol system protein YtxJ